MQPPIEKKMSMEEIFVQFMQTQQVSIKNLEIQLGQLASALNNGPAGRLQSDTQVLRMEEDKECDAVELRSGKELPALQESKAAYKWGKWKSRHGRRK